jgi:hypothetical protein
MKGTELEASDYKAGDHVRIKSLTDVDTRLPEDETYGLIGMTATIVEPAINDYYDCTIKPDEPMPVLGESYGNPPILAMLYVDLEKVNPESELDNG